MLEMRYAYVKTRQDDWQQAQLHLEKAEALFRKVADFRGVYFISFAPNFGKDSHKTVAWPKRPSYPNWSLG